MASMFFEENSEYDDYDNADFTSELLPHEIQLVEVETRSCWDILLCRKKPPSVRDSLAVVGLKCALLVGMLSNIELDDEEEEYEEGEGEEENFNRNEATTKLDSKIVNNNLNLPTIETSKPPNGNAIKHSPVVKPKVKKDLKKSFAESTSFSTSMSSPEEVKAPPPRYKNRKRPSNIGECKKKNPTSFATLMFDKNAPRLSAKDMLNIPLTVPPNNTPPPKLKYTIASAGEGKRKTYKQGRSYISVHSSSSETVIEGNDDRIVITAPDSDDSNGMPTRRHSTFPSDIKKCQQDPNDEWDSNRRHSIHPPCGENDTSATTTRVEVQVSQNTLKVPSFRTSYGNSNRLQVPSRHSFGGNVVQLTTSSNSNSSQLFRPVAPPHVRNVPSSNSATRRKIRAQKFQRQKSVDVSTNSEDSIIHEEQIPLVSSQTTQSPLLCSHCATSLDQLTTFKYSESLPSICEQPDLLEVAKVKRKDFLKKSALSVDSKYLNPATEIWMNELEKQSNIKVTHL